MYKFSKKERLCAQKILKKIHEKGSSKARHPVRFIWRLEPLVEVAPQPIQVAFSVPKRNFKRAVDRNFFKRRLREAWRLHKHSIAPMPPNYTLRMIIMYQGKDVFDYQEIEVQVKKMIHTINTFILNFEDNAETT
jgi:ribonuclease P protein component